MRLPALLAHPDPVAAQIASCAGACVAAGGTLTPAEREWLAVAVAALRHRIHDGDLWRADRVACFRTRDLLIVARHIRDADREPDAQPAVPATQ